MHVENELVEIVTTDDHEFEKIVEEYKEVLVREEVPKPPPTDSANTAPAQGKPRCITLIFDNHYMHICHVHLCYRNFMETTCIDISVLRVLLVQVRVAAMLRFLVA